jgi:Insertion element 4 transposase N-terminal
MTLRIRHIDPDATPSRQVSLEALARIVPEATVREVLKECNATEQRTRKLSASFVVILCVAMNLYTNDCITHLFFRLLSRVGWLLADPMMAVHVSKGALCQARYRLGARPLVALFKRVCSKPLAEPETVPEAFLFGLCALWLSTAPWWTCQTPLRTFESSASTTPHAERVPGRRRGCSP